MPELPEVETMVRGIRSEVTGRQIIRTEICRCSRKPIRIHPSRRSFVRNTTQTCITGVERLAKRVILQLSTGHFIVIEPRMTGLILLSDPPTNEHRRICWHLDPRRGRSPWIQFWDRRGLGTVSLLDANELDQVRDRLGTDALQLNTDQLAATLRQTSTSIKVCLLDQKRIAGIGNLYASEILHRARISPFLPANSLSRPQVRALCSAVRSVMQEAVLSEGSTLGDGTYRNALNQDGSYQNQHRVYQRAGEECPRCRQIIERSVQAQRSTFYCPRCQR